MNALSSLLSVVSAYLLGSIPTGYLLTRRLKGVDVRTVGSGNVGATNVARVVGKSAGIVVLIADTLKGALAVTLVPRLIWGALATRPSPGVLLWCGLAVVAGHDWSCWLNFRGGKGVATSLGVLLGVAPQVAAGCAVVWVLTFAWSRMVSLSSIVTSCALPLILLVLRYSASWIAFGFVLGLVAVIRHNSNIQRIIHNKEEKFRAS